MAHVLPGMQKVYNRFDYRDEKLTLFQEWEALLAAIVVPPPVKIERIPMQVKIERIPMQVKTERKPMMNVPRPPMTTKTARKPMSRA